MTARRAFTLPVLVVLFGAFALTACLPVPPPASIPFPGVPPISHDTGGACRRVLVIGDSLGMEIESSGLAAEFASSGRCVDVVSRSAGGSSVIDWGPDGSLDVRAVLDDVHPDVVVIVLVGNTGVSGPPWSDPSWLTKTTAAALAIVDAALARNVSVYWALPPKSGWACNWADVSAQRFAQWHAWIRDELWVSRPIHPLDLRTPFGGETFSRWFSFPDGSIHELRQVDCVHFTDEGANIAAQAIVAATQAEWTTPAVTVAPDETTSTTEPSATTSTTTAPAG